MKRMNDIEIVESVAQVLEKCGIAGPNCGPYYGPYISNFSSSSEENYTTPCVVMLGVRGLPMTELMTALVKELLTDVLRNCVVEIEQDPSIGLLEVRMVGFTRRRDEKR